MKINWRIIFDVFYFIFVVFLVISLVVVAYFLGFKKGELVAIDELSSYLSQIKPKQGESSNLSTNTPKPTLVVSPSLLPKKKSVDWTGPQLWEAVNKSRVENGVNPLKQADELCTIASIRLNELLELGKLDGHEGFSSLPERRPDLKWIFEKYNISEFLIAGAASPQEAVDSWLDTLGHKKLLTGGEYVWGCTYAQNGFGVAIAAYQ